MTIKFEIWPVEDFARSMAARIEAALPDAGAVVITGGTTAAKVYGVLNGLDRWDGLDVLFSDERCVPPDHDESNFRMATELFLGRTNATVHRMPGELDPLEGALRYHDEIAAIIAKGPRIAFMGMGADCHVGALYPGSAALDNPNYCAAVDRPDGMKGLTLTPTAMLACDSINLLVAGARKADAVRRVVEGAESPESCPARVLAEHPGITMCLDEEAAKLLS